MKRIAGAEILNALILRGTSGKRTWASLAAMTTGLTLLLGAVLLWWNFNELLHGRASKDEHGSTFLTVSRRVTNEAMGRPELTVFSQKDINEMSTAPQVEDVGIVQSLKPRAYMSMQLGLGAGFSTVMILESVPDRFMDKRPAEWSWQPGSRRVPVILSSSFLSLYNYAFAPSQGLPQLSEESIKALPFKLSIGEGEDEVVYVAQITGFSDRITSVLVPESFVQAANGSAPAAPSRLVLKVKDPSDASFAKFLDGKGYITNSEMLRWSRLRAIVQSVALIMGVLALLLLGISLLVFVLFIELTIARAQHSLQLLKEIGYSPAALRSFLAAKFIPMFGSAVAIAMLIALAGQMAAHFAGTDSGLQLSLLPGWPVWVCFLAVGVLLILQLRQAIAKALTRN